MNQPRASRLIAVPAPALYGLAFGAALIIDYIVRWRPSWMSPLHWAGWVLFAGGLILGPGSSLLFAMKRTTLNPAGQPSRLVTTGPFQLSRNPMYVGLALTYVGAAIAFNRPWALVLLPFPLLVLSKVVIPFEETRLDDTFGADFRAYRQRVRRWL